MSDAAPSARFATARAVTFVLVGAFIALSPAHWHVPSARSSHLPEWAMFHRVGEGQCRVRFYTVGPGGALALVDRRAVLGLDRPNVDRTRRALRKPRRVLEQARRICRRFRISDLRADAACATLDGWQQAYTVEENLCPKGRRRKGKAR